MALSPWPNAGTQARTDAIATLRGEVTNGLPLKNPDGTPDTDGETKLTERLNRWGSVAAAMVEKEAENAPQAIKDEAVIRFAGYLSDADWGAHRGETLGPKSIEHVTNHAPMFRNCGAKALLAPWRTLRAGLVG